MSGLDKHDGSDASLEPEAVQQISRWLQAEAGTYKQRVAEAPPIAPPAIPVQTKATLTMTA
jgi:hypothetical protein